MFAIHNGFSMIVEHHTLYMNNTNTGEPEEPVTSRLPLIKTHKACANFKK